MQFHLLKVVCGFLMNIISTWQKRGVVKHWMEMVNWSCIPAVAQKHIRWLIILQFDYCSTMQTITKERLNVHLPSTVMPAEQKK